MLKIRKFFLLPKREMLLFSQAIILLIYYRWCLAYKPLIKLLPEVEQRANTFKKTVSPVIELAQISRLVTVASQYVPYTTCFSRALAGKIIFARYGYNTILKIGVAKTTEAELEAHAWLMDENQVVLCNIEDIERYTEIPIENVNM